MRDTPVIIVDIDDNSIQKEGRWPWPREKFARLVSQIQKAGALVVAFDITFTEPEVDIADKLFFKLKQDYPDLVTPKITEAFKNLSLKFNSDDKFAQTLSAGQNVLSILFSNHKNLSSVGILPSPLFSVSAQEKSQLLIPEMLQYATSIPLLQNAAKYAGFVNFWPDEDGVIRSAPLLLRYGNNIYGSLALEAARLFLLIDKIEIQTVNVGSSKAVEFIKFGDAFIPTDAYGRILIPYSGHAKSFVYLSATDILNHKINLAPLKNALVFVGSTSLMLGDFHPTPIDPVYPGVAAHASIANALIKENFRYKPVWATGAENLLIIVIGIISSFLFPFMGLVPLIVLGLLEFLALFGGTYWLLEYHGLILTPVIPAFLILAIAVENLVYGFFFEFRSRMQMAKLFGQYVPPLQVKLMSEDPKRYTFEGKNKYLTVLFSDIRDFTKISESLEASEVKNLLNQFLTAMTAIIFRHKGTIDKYVGDMIMAFWGSPLEDKDHVKNAINAALDMISKKEALKSDFANINLPQVDIGIGLNTGLMYVGDMGSEYRRAYTVLGDSVNLGSRLEALTRKYKVDIIVNETTQNEAPQDFIYRKLDRVIVKGKLKPTDIFEVVCRTGEANEALLEEIRLFEKVQEYYYAQNWNAARQGLSILLNTPGQLSRYIYTLYQERITLLEQQTLPADWNGVFRWTEK